MPIGTSLVNYRHTRRQIYAYLQALKVILTVAIDAYQIYHIVGGPIYGRILTNRYNTSKSTIVITYILLYNQSLVQARAIRAEVKFRPTLFIYLTLVIRQFYKEVDAFYSRLLLPYYFYRTKESYPTQLKANTTILNQESLQKLVDYLYNQDDKPKVSGTTLTFTARDQPTD